MHPRVSFLIFEEAWLTVVDLVGILNIRVGRKAPGNGVAPGR